jgi:predicted molibdopterin-dependent oxidoreductase YjgC
MSQSFHICIDGRKIEAKHGQTLSAVLLSNGYTTCKYSVKNHQPRGMYCGMGICWECTVVVDGQENVRSCITLAAPGMEIQTRNQPLTKADE